MKYKREWTIFTLVLGLIGAVVMQVSSTKFLVSPLWVVGNGLRKLSLSGEAWNIMAWIILIVSMLIPVVYMLARICKKRMIYADFLLLLLSIQIGYLLYFLVNPTLTKYPGDLPLSDGFALMYIWAFIATCVGYILLRVLERVDFDASSGRLLPRLLQVSGLILIGVSGYNYVSYFLLCCRRVTDANTEDMTFTVVIVAVLTLCKLIPAVLGGMTLLWSADIATALMIEPYSEDSIELCTMVATWCNKVAVCSILVSIGCNITQILFATKLYHTNITLDIPLLTLLLSSALYLLCHHIQGAKVLADDNDSII